MSQRESFGIMDQGYFVPRTEILDWLNNLLHLNLTKIEQLGSGAVYCQVIDAIHPGKIAISKVNWKAKNDYEFISNLKLLQVAFDKIGIKRYVEVEKLARAKYQDNLEFVQWLKRYFDTNGGERGNNYQPEERRGGAFVDFSFAEKNVVPKTYNGTGQVISSQDPVPVKAKQQSNVVSSIAAYRKQPTKQPRRQNVPQVSNKPQGGQTQKVRQLEAQLSKIRQILISTDSSDDKVNQISELLNIAPQKVEATLMEEEQAEQVL